MTFPLTTATSIEDLESALAELPPADMPVTHRFTPGLYIREILIPAGTIATSMEHRTEHPFVLSAGVVEVVDSHGQAQLLQAPYTGITRPGTKRALRALTDVVWTTFHVTDKTDVEQIAAEILVPQPDPARNQWRRELPPGLPDPSACHCHDCNPAAWWMILCPECGNKRCPRATHHDHACTGSNEPGQPGSIYPPTSFTV